MKRIILTTLMAFSFLTSSCANQTSPLEFTKFYPLGPTCDISEFVDGFFVANGSLDVAWGNPVYVVAFQLTNAEGYTQPALQIGDTVLERANREQPVLRQIIIQYRPSRPLGVSLKEHVIPYTGIVGGNIQGTVQLISPELSRALADTLTPANDLSDVVDINIDVHFEGEMVGSRTKISTATMTFPLRVFRSAPPAGFSCANGTRRFRTDAVTGDSCLYIGQSYNQVNTPVGPYQGDTVDMNGNPVPGADCCTAPGSPEC